MDNNDRLNIMININFQQNFCYITGHNHDLHMKLLHIQYLNAVWSSLTSAHQQYGEITCWEDIYSRADQTVPGPPF